MSGTHEMVGAAMAVGSALLYDIGYALEKQALTRLPPMRLHPVDLLDAARRSRRWLAGFVAMLGGLGLQVMALTLAPVSVVQPILAGGLIALAAAGSRLLGEQLNRRQRIALGLILAAVICVAVSARGVEPLAHGVPALRLSVMAALILALAVPAGVAVSRGGRRAGRDLTGLVVVAGGAGLLYGLGAVAEKAVAARLSADGVVAGALSSLATAYPWLFLAVTVAGMLLFQLGLQAQPASLMASFTNVVSTACALAGASVVFGEALLPSGWWSLPRLAGFAAVLAAVAVLTVDAPAAPEIGPPDPALVR